MNVVLFAVGLLYLASRGPVTAAFLAFGLLTSYFGARFVKGRKWVLILTLSVNAAALLFIRLLPVLPLSPLAPFGISYYTFQILSYLTDVNRGKYEPEKNFFWYAYFLTFLPHLFSGPIERYDDLCRTLKQKRRVTWESFSNGALRALWGGFKIFVIANRAGVLVSAVTADPVNRTGAFALLAMLLYSVQLYASFSGTIDAAVGLSRIFGIRLSENFDAPYFSESFQEFWRRWHITLGAWLKDYVYIPLGGNRKGKARKVLNLVLTFLVSGIWHGLNFLLWGLINGLFVALGDKLKTRLKGLNIVLTFLAVSLLWCFFIWPTAGQALAMLGSVFTTFNYAALFAALPSMGLSLYDGIVLAAAVALLTVFDLKRRTLPRTLSGFRPEVKTVLIGALALSILALGVYGIGFNAAGFVYTGM